MPPVLIVDDTDSVRLILDLILTKAGYGVVVAEDGFRAVEIARQQPIGAAIIDVVMPGMNGFEVARQLRAQSMTHGQNLPFWIMSANDNPENRRKAQELGALAFFAKPFECAKVIAAVEKQLGKPAPETRPPG